MPNSALSRAATSAWGMPSTTNVADRQSVGVEGGPRRRTPGMAARPVAQAGGERRRRGRRWPPSRSARARRWPRARATAPMTLGEPASSRSGGSVHTTSSRSTRSTAPPPARNGSPSVNASARADRARRPRTGRTSCGRSRRRSRRCRGQRPVRRELRGVDQHRHAACVRGGDDLVDRRQPAGDVGGAGDGEQPRVRAVVERGDDVVGAEGAVAVALDEATPGERVAQGSRLAWCSTTVVTTTSSAARRSR